MDVISWNLLLQIPLAGVVVLVVVLFLRHLKEITTAFMAAQAKQADASAIAQKEQIVLFMGAIKEQREENLQSLSELSKNLGDLSKMITSRLNKMATAKAVHQAKQKGD
ncbi:MAG: hypothetical protein ABSG01_08880 [Anaerolineales bacterium]|jgi:hypothetical protein